MFMHAGLRPVWPVIAFVPWLLLGAACLLYAAAHRMRASLGLPGERVKTRSFARARQLALVSVLGLALLAATRVVVADPAAEESPACKVATAAEARSLADRLYDQGEYRRAGQCYQAAGDLARANLAFLQAAGPAGADTARGLKEQRDTAKALFAGVGRAFKGNH